jgi:hypothetical protein
MIEVCGVLSSCRAGSRGTARGRREASTARESKIPWATSEKESIK